MLQGKTVLLGVSGGIACYKAAQLASDLVKLHCCVHVLMTQNATQFITPLTFEALTGNRPVVDTFDRNFPHEIKHISLADQADLVLVAPATANVIANILGLGWAATPSGLKAMEALAKLEEDRRSGSRYPGQPQGRPKGTASNEMCNFLILNISSLQLIPVNIIAYRSQYGSVCPTAVVGPAIAATAVSTAAAILFFKIADRRSRL